MDKPKPKNPQKTHEIRIPKDATKDEILKFMKKFKKNYEISKLICEITKNPCGTDTWQKSPSGKLIACRCSNCQKLVNE